MRLIPRRKFLKLAAAAAALSAIPLPRAHSSPASVGNSLYRRYASELYRWYCQHFFDFDSALSTKEKDLIANSISLMDDSCFQISDQFSYSLIAFSHRIRRERVNSSRLAVGSFARAKKLQPFMLDVLKSRGVSAKRIPNIDKLIGVGWDLEEEHLKAYMYIPSLAQIADSTLKRLMAKAQDLAVHQKALTSVTYKNGKPFEYKVYLAAKERLPELAAGYPFGNAVIHTNYMITDKRGIVPQVDIDGSLDPAVLGDLAAPILQAYAARDISEIDTIAYRSPHELTLYFP